MTFLSEIVKPVHDACRAMKATLDSDAVIKKASVQTWYDKVDEAATAINKRMFILMTAQERGWEFARKLDFYESGYWIVFIWF
jgi:hypothetical protein